MKKLIFGAFLSVAAAASAVTVESVDLQFVDDAKRTMWISYLLDGFSGERAIVTLEILKDGVPLSANQIELATGDVYREIADVQSYGGMITCRVAADVGGTLTARVKAWPIDDPPDVMVVDLNAAVGSAYKIAYYPSLDWLPDFPKNPEWKSRKLVMKRVHAPVGGKWVMGALPGTETPSSSASAGYEISHEVTLDEDYYLGVFELTQYQAFQIHGAWPNSSNGNGPWFDGCGKATGPANYSLRPLEYNCFNFVRGGDCSTDPDKFQWKTLVGRLRTSTGYDFDFPSENQWEYAARAGHGNGFWGDGSEMLYEGTPNAASVDENLSRYGRYAHNGGSNGADRNVDPAVGGTAVVGSYRPNDWGFYDMAGNVKEFCRDYFVGDITAKDGAVQYPSGTPDGSDKYVVRGGSYLDAYYNCRPASRASWQRNNNQKENGCRLYCPIGKH